MKRDSLILAMKDRFYPITKAIYVLYLEQGNGEFVASALGIISMLILAACILSASAILGKKMGEFAENIRLDPAVNSFPLSFHLYQPSPVQFLQVVGDSRWRNIHSFSQLSHTIASCVIGTA